VATKSREKHTQDLSVDTFKEIFIDKGDNITNPIKAYKEKNGYSRYRFARLVKSNTTTLEKVERGDCKDIIAFEIIKGMAVQFDDVNEKEMVIKYLEYKKNQ
jgi:DNA-binding XRE family transcriptional regulator